jgi:hypothetical protein
LDEMPIRCRAFLGKGLHMISYLIVVITTVSLGLAFVPTAWASSTSDTCVALANARTALYAMLSVKDKAALDELNSKIQATSTRVDSLLAGMTGADAKVAADFKTVWVQFKATREEQMIPAIYKGSIDDAKKIADGIQLERFSKMWRIMSCK